MSQLKSNLFLISWRLLSRDEQWAKNRLFNRICSAYLNTYFQELDFLLGGSSKMYNDFEDFLRLLRLTMSLTVSFLHNTRVLNLISAANPQTSASPKIEI